MKLEAAIHQYKGNKEKTKKWLDRFQSDHPLLRKVQLGQLLYFTGSHVEILEPSLTLRNLED